MDPWEGEVMRGESELREGTPGMMVATTAAAVTVAAAAKKTQHTS